MLACIRSSHTRVTDGYLLRDEPAPVSINCGVLLTVLHTLAECPRYGDHGHIFHLHGTLSDMVGDDRSSVYNVVAFLNAIGRAR